MSYCDNCASLLAENSQLKTEVAALLAACKMVQKRLEESRGGVVSFTGEEWTQIDNAIAAAKGVTL